MSQLVQAVWAYSGAFGDGIFRRKLVRPATYISQVIWNTLEAMAVIPYVTADYLP